MKESEKFLLLSHKPVEFLSSDSVHLIFLLT